MTSYCFKSPLLLDRPLSEIKVPTIKGYINFHTIVYKQLPMSVVKNSSCFTELNFPGYLPATASEYSYISKEGIRDTLIGLCIQSGSNQQQITSTLSYVV